MVAAVRQGEALDESVDYFDMPPEKRVPMNMRIPASLRAHLEAILELWKVVAETQGLDPDALDLTYVVERLLRVGVDGAWAQAAKEAGIEGTPKTPVEIERFKERILEHARLRAEDSGNGKRRK